MGLDESKKVNNLLTDAVLGQNYRSFPTSGRHAFRRRAIKYKGNVLQMWKRSIQWTDGVLLLNGWILPQMQKIWRAEKSRKSSSSTCVRQRRKRCAHGLQECV